VNVSKKERYFSNVEWTKVGQSRDMHLSKEIAQSICKKLINKFGIGMTPCKIRGNCLKVWVESYNNNVIKGFNKKHTKLGGINEM